MPLDPDLNKKFIASLQKYGIDNKNLQAAIIAVTFKESNYKPVSENLKYSAKRISEVWKKIPPEIAVTLANNPEKLGDYVYGNKYGNAANEGYKYRGRGLNQITFKDNYKLIGNLIGKDLVSNPDLLNQFDIAADATAAFFKYNIDQGIKRDKFKKFNVTSLDQIKDTTTALKIAIQTNAGLNTSFDNNIVQEGYKKALSVIEDIYKNIGSGAKKAVSGGLIVALALGAYFFFKRK
jgi:putative chitinase